MDLSEYPEVRKAIESAGAYRRPWWARPPLARFFGWSSCQGPASDLAWFATAPLRRVRRTVRRSR